MFKIFIKCLSKYVISHFPITSTHFYPWNFLCKVQSRMTWGGGIFFLIPQHSQLSRVICSSWLLEGIWNNGWFWSQTPPPCHLLTHHTLSSVWSGLRSIISLWQLRFWYFFHKIILIPLEFSLQGAVKDNMGGGVGIFFLIPLTLTTLKGHMFLMVIRRMK